MSQVLVSPWISLLVLLGLVLAARSIRPNWLAPSVFAPLIWSFYVFLPLCLASEYRVSALGTGIIVLLVAGLVMGAVLAEGRASSGSSQVTFTPRAMPSILRWVLLLSAVSFMGAVCAAAKAVGNYGLDFSLSGLLAVGHLLSVERYSGEQTPWLVRILLTWVFPAALLGGMAFANARSRRERLLSLVPLLSALAFSLVQAVKAASLVAAVLGIGGYLSARTWERRLAGSSRLRNMLLIASGTLAMAVSFFVGIDALRTHKAVDDEVQVEADWGRLRSSMLGYLAVFGNWAERSQDQFRPTLGQYTFGGLLEAAGLHVRELGVYTEMVSLDADHNDSNIYTAFRGLIEDFSLPGALCFCIAAGYLAGKAYQNLSSGRIRYILVLAGFYSFLIWSPIGSVFVYNGPILAFLVAAFVLKRCAAGAESRDSGVMSHDAAA